MKNLIKNSQRTSRGFTLVELLVVMAIIMALAALGFAGIQNALIKSKVVKTKNVATNISQAVQSFMDEYASMPVDSPLTGDTEYQTDQQDFTKVLQILKGKETGTTAHVNVRDLDLLVIADAKNNLDGIVWQSNSPSKILDSWGKPFTLIIDGDYSKEITIPGKYRRKGDQEIYRGSASITLSPGPDRSLGSEQTNKDNVTTW